MLHYEYTQTWGEGPFPSCILIVSRTTLTLGWDRAGHSETQARSVFVMPSPEADMRKPRHEVQGLAQIMPYLLTLLVAPRIFSV